MKTYCLYIIIFLLSSHAVEAQVYGCTDPLATNYDALATDNDGSCAYPNSSVSPVSSTNLANNLSETSGLIAWNSSVWTHNDNSDINLYSLDTIDGAVIQSYPLTGLANIDWEEISQDSNYVYVGDFGNNVNGNRTDLKIFRIEKNSLLAQAPVIDTIYFSYSDQVDFTPTGSNNTDFDCEAMVVTSDSIYLFTKQWVSSQSGLYVLPKIPGTHSAVLKTTFDTQGMITGATLMQSQRIIALCGYTNLLQPFTWMLYDFTGAEYFNGNKRHISIPLPFHQMEGIATADGLTYYMTNEYFSIIATPQKFHVFDLSSFLGNYLTTSAHDAEMTATHDNILLYPNPVTEKLYIEFGNKPAGFSMVNATGETVKAGKLDSFTSEINISALPQGIYFLKVDETKSSRIKVIKN